MAAPAANNLPDPVQIQADQLAAQERQNELLEAILESVRHQSMLSERQLAITTTPVQSVWFKARIPSADSAHSGDGDWRENFGNVLITAEDNVKAQLAAWKADPANNRKLVVAETLSSQEQEAVHTNGEVYMLGFVYLYVQYKEL